MGKRRMKARARPSRSNLARALRCVTAVRLAVAALGEGRTDIDLADLSLPYLIAWWRGHQVKPLLFQMPSHYFLALDEYSSFPERYLPPSRRRRFSRPAIVLGTKDATVLATL